MSVQYRVRRLTDRETARVVSLKSSDRVTIIGLNGGEEVRLRPYLYVGPGDVLEFHPSVQHYTDIQLVRIPRVVVHPEFRGMGLGAMIARHLVDYCREYWDIRGYAPIAIEVIASMTEYHRFFEAAGFMRAGDTLGYQEGIAPLYGSGSWAERPNSSQYDFLREQKPKPYLIYPLDNSVRGALMEKGLFHSNHTLVKPKPKSPATRISFRKLFAEYRAANGWTARAKEVREAFDVDSRQMQSPVLQNFSLDIEPGEVVLITGASGSGKSTVLRFLAEEHTQLKDNMTIQGFTAGLNPALTAHLGSKWDDSLPLVDQVGDSVKEAIGILNSVGLAEAHLYVKRPSQISAGQRYRFAVALLCDSKKPVWVADEFASTLDPLTSAIVAKGIRKRAYVSGATLIVAAPHFENFVDSLVPNKLVTLRWGGLADTLSLKCTFKMVGDSIDLRIANTCRQELTGVQVLGLDLNGERRVVRSIGILKAKDSIKVGALPFEELAAFSGLVILSHQQIGDILYFQSQQA